MIFQEPLTSLNPVFTIGDQLGEAVRIGLEKEEEKNATKSRKEEIRDLSIEWLRKVGLADPDRALQRYPHELSGGMRQRVIIGIALATKPSLILADEPTSALDVTTQSQILDLLKSLIKETKTSVLFISHDLAVVAQIADRVVVMYAGMIIESAKTLDIFGEPLHPYTEALLSCLPHDEGQQDRLEVISGNVPDLLRKISSCPFSPRCKYAIKACETMPDLKEALPGRYVACWLR
jgi:peptide/nickel transport system ATP-binding protein